MLVSWNPGSSPHQHPEVVHRLLLQVHDCACLLAHPFLGNQVLRNFTELETVAVVSLAEIFFPKSWFVWREFSETLKGKKEKFLLLFSDLA